MEYGLIGEHLSHSYSREIHQRIRPLPYALLEVAKEELDRFLTEAPFRGINVTIPYKQAVLPYLSGIDPHAEAIGAVNTVLHRADGLYGYNTDFYGMQALLSSMGISLQDKKVLILGNGGTARTARAVAKAGGASEILTVSRTPSAETCTYEEMYLYHKDAQIILQTTPVGMYPKEDASPISLDGFTRLEGVLDAIYHPLRTRLVQDAQARGIPAEGGLRMLVAQAVYASALFAGEAPKEEDILRVYREVRAEKENIVLIGMPGAGKTTVGKCLADALHRPFYDTDAVIASRYGKPVPDCIQAEGIDFFRRLEGEVIAELGSDLHGAVIATGGGAVLADANVFALRKNGRLYWLDRPIAEILPTPDRPLSSDREALEARYRERKERYTAAADVRISEFSSAEATCRIIMEEYQA